MMALWESGLWRRGSPPLGLRALRPTAEDLESRQLLAAMVSGTDVDGDTWTLRLIGPGSLTVVKQAGADGNPAPLNSATEIDTITVAGTNPLSSQLVGTVKKGPNGDGKVFFNTFDELPITVRCESPGSRARPAGDQHARLLARQYDSGELDRNRRSPPRSRSPTA